MPPRGIVIAVVLFWLGNVVWLANDQILPRWRAGQAPDFHIDLTDEVGSPSANWDLFKGDKLVGRGHSRVKRHADRTFELTQTFQFHDLRIPAATFQVTVRRMESAYRVTSDGKLKGLRAVAAAALGDGKPGAPAPEIEGTIEGEVVDGQLQPRMAVKLFGTPLDLPAMRPVDLGESANILNPMHLVHRLPGLREGQRWRVSLVDPFKILSASELIGNLGGGGGPTFLEAEVDAAVREWNGHETPCFRIVYREPGKDATAETWVRRADGLVLFQEAKHQTLALSIRRSPSE